MSKKISNIGMQNKVAEELQKLVRLKYADKNGYIKCVTCILPEPRYWEKDSMQGGHFIRRSALRLEETNIHPQCAKCNNFDMKHDTRCVLRYRRYIDDLYGEGYADELERMSWQIQKYTMAELKDMLTETKNRIKEIREEKGL